MSNDTPTSLPRPEFWQALGVGQFRLPHCARCDRWHPPGASRCERCGGTLDWRRTTGAGQVYSLMERYAQGGGDTLAVAVVTLDIGPRMMAVLRLPSDTLTVGDRVRPAPSPEPIEGLPEFVR